MIGTVSVPGRWCLVAATATWFGVVVSGWAMLGVIGLVISAAGLTVGVRRSAAFVAVVASFAVLGFLSGTSADLRTAAIGEAGLPEGRVTMTVRIVEEPDGSRYGRVVGAPVAIDGVPWGGPRLAVEGVALDGKASVRVGTTLTVEGVVRRRVSRVRDEIIAGTITVDDVIASSESTNPILVVGNAIRGRVTAVYDDPDSGDGLVRGLLIGDTSLLTAGDEEDLRRSGLAHYIAVSGSNVAMFLAAWWFLTVPLSIRPILRIGAGLVGLAVFAVVTRWEPSVIRASVMAAVPLLGGLVGIPFDPWMALGTAVTVLLLVSGQLALSVGFQLSVAATAGVLLGVSAAKDREPAWLYMPLFATMGAQLLVAPIILIVFGSIPLVAPAANLVVAPIVAVTTAVASVALVVSPIAVFADFGASTILMIAEAAASGPQLGWGGAALAIVVGGMIAWRPARPIGLSLAAVAFLVSVGSGAPWPSEPTMVALDIGQGDAILFQDPSGAVMLVDGGPDPRVLDRALRRHHVRSVTVIVVTHGDLDHVGGVVEILGSGRVSELWVPRFVKEEGLLAEAITAARTSGVTVSRVGTGVVRMVGAMRVEVLGPSRRYQSDNDGSVSLLVSAGREAFLGGDIEAAAQSELPDLHPDVMIVPHHGSGTTATRWLQRTAGPLAVLSYGTNRYGHPHPDIVRVLDDLGVEVRHTYLEGDISVPLGWPR